MDFVSADLFISYFFTRGREASTIVVGCDMQMCNSLLPALALPWESGESFQSLKMADEF